MMQMAREVESTQLSIWSIICSKSHLNPFTNPSCVCLCLEWMKFCGGERGPSSSSSCLSIAEIVSLLSYLVLLVFRTMWWFLVPSKVYTFLFSSRLSSGHRYFLYLLSFSLIHFVFLMFSLILSSCLESLPKMHCYSLFTPILRSSFFFSSSLLCYFRCSLSWLCRWRQRESKT